MRIRVIHKPPQCSVDGIRLDQLAVGSVYDLCGPIGTLFLAEGWGELVDADESADVTPLRDVLTRVRNPPRLIREIFPSDSDAPPALAADRRRKPRT